jgi:hypothetical protein
MKRSDLIEALQIVSKYEVPEYSLCSEHDCLWIAPEIPGLTYEDEARLRELGFSSPFEGESHSWGGFT